MLLAFAAEHGFFARLNAHNIIVMRLANRRTNMLIKKMKDKTNEKKYHINRK